MLFGGADLAGLQDVGDALHVGAEVHQLHAPVDHHHVARLDDARVRRGDDAGGAGDVDRGHVELGAEGAIEQAILHPPRDVFERRLAGRDHFVRQRPLGQLDRDVGGFAERDDFRRDAMRSEVGDQFLCRHESRRERVAERRLQVREHRHRQAIRRPDLLRHVEADALGIARLDVIGERRCRRDDVVGARLVQHVAARAERGALDAIAAAIGEDVIADAGHIAAAQIVPERVVVVFLDGDDPHVDAVLAHRARQDLLELIEPDLALHFPTPPGFLCVRWQDLQQDDRECDQKSHRFPLLRCQSPLHSVTSGSGFRAKLIRLPILDWRTIQRMNLHMLSARLLVIAMFVGSAALASAQTAQDGGINYDTARTTAG